MFQRNTSCYSTSTVGSTSDWLNSNSNPIRDLSDRQKFISGREKKEKKRRKGKGKKKEKKGEGKKKIKSRRFTDSPSRTRGKLETVMPFVM